MALPPRSFYTLNEAALRWEIVPADIIGWALEGHIHLSAALPPVQAGGIMLAGLCTIEPADIFPLFRRDGSGPAAVQIKRARPEMDGEPAWIGEPADGVTLMQADVLIMREELKRFEHEFEPFGGAQPGTVPQGRRKPGPGAPARYDWDAFYAAMLRRLYDEGLPATQAELVREMQDWFDHQDPGGGGGPDESTIRRKVQAVWRELHG